MGTEEVHFSHRNSRAIDRHCDRYGRDKGAEYALTSHSNDPGWLRLGRVQCPSEEIDRVVEAELTLIVLNVMVLQESVNLLRLSVVVQVHSDPLVTLRQWVWLLLNLFNCLALDRLVEL